MTSLELNDLTAKVEQSGNLSSSTFYPSKINELTPLTQKVEVEQERPTPKKSNFLTTTMEDSLTSSGQAPESLDEKSILDLFLLQMQKKYSADYCLGVEQVSQFLFEYSKRKNKTVFTLTESELDEIRRSWFDIELNPSLPVSDVVLLKWSYCIRIFYQWTFEKGYSRHFILEHWKLSHIKAFIQGERERRTQELKSKTRYYNLKEILRAYGKYLKETYENYEAWQMFFQSLRHFLRFLIGRKESFYTVTEESIEAYKQKLFHHEYQPGRYYTAYFQANRLRAVKRFFDWFTVKGYSVNHPLKKFGVETYRKQIEPLYQEREQKRTNPQDIPGAFQQIYQSIEAHESTLGLAKETLRTHRRGWRVFFHYLEKSLGLRLIENRLSLYIKNESKNAQIFKTFRERSSRSIRASKHTRAR